MKFICKEQREMMRMRMEEERLTRLQAEASRQRGIMDYKHSEEISNFNNTVNARLDRIEKNVNPPKTYKRNKDAFWEKQNNFSKYNNDNGCDDDW